MRRRQLLQQALLTGVAALLGACRRAGPPKGGDPPGLPPDGADPDSGIPDGDSTDDSPCGGEVGAGWTAVPLAAHPALVRPGGSAPVDVDEALLHLIVAHTSPGCFTAVWRVCTHGACELGWDPAAGEAVCPCHGSRYGPDGAVRLGPATRGVRSFPVVRRGGQLHIGPGVDPSA
jgi:cytochrome b6-f complex iron-sulfur subunit